jgi:hypothetical protein
MGEPNPMDTAMRFLQHPDVARVPIRERAAFLRARGIPSSVVEDAIRAVSTSTAVTGWTSSSPGPIGSEALPAPKRSRGWVEWAVSEATEAIASLGVGVAIGWAARRWIRDSAHQSDVPSLSSPHLLTPSPPGSVSAPPGRANPWTPSLTAGGYALPTASSSLTAGGYALPTASSSGTMVVEALRPTSSSDSGSVAAVTALAGAMRELSQKQQQSLQKLDQLIRLSPQKDVTRHDSDMDEAPAVATRPKIPVSTVDQLVRDAEHPSMDLPLALILARDILTNAPTPDQDTLDRHSLSRLQSRVRQGLLVPLALELGLDLEQVEASRPDEVSDDATLPAAVSDAVGRLASLWRMMGLIVRNLRKQPDVPRFRRLSPNNRGFAESVLGTSGADAALASVGFRAPGGETPWRSDATQTPDTWWEWVWGDMVQVEDRERRRVADLGILLAPPPRDSDSDSDSPSEDVAATGVWGETVSVGESDVPLHQVVSHADLRHVASELLHDAERGLTKLAMAKPPRWPELGRLLHAWRRAEGPTSSSSSTSSSWTPTNIPALTPPPRTGTVETASEFIKRYMLDQQSVHRAPLPSAEPAPDPRAPQLRAQGSIPHPRPPKPWEVSPPDGMSPPRDSITRGDIDV